MSSTTEEKNWRKQWKKRLTKQEQMSEAFILSAFLAFSGGFQDAYTYIVRDGVFANAQTGNIVLMSTHLLAGEWRPALRYLIPLLAFAGGVLCTEQVQGKFKFAKSLHWRQGILLGEMVLLLIAGLVPESMNMISSAIVSFSCAMQVQAFRKVAGNAYASTMCIGNLRSGTASLSTFMRIGKREDLKKALCYYAIIAIFGIGAGIGGNLSAALGIRSVWVCCAALFAAFLLMETDRERKHDAG